MSPPLTEDPENEVPCVALSRLRLEFGSLLGKFTPHFLEGNTPRSLSPTVSPDRGGYPGLTSYPELGEFRSSCEAESHRGGRGEFSGPGTPQYTVSGCLTEEVSGLYERPYCINGKCVSRSSLVKNQRRHRGNLAHHPLK